MKNILSKFRDSDKSTFIFFLFVFTLVIILFLFPRQAKFKYEFTKGKPWLHESIIAPFDFSILKSENELSNEENLDDLGSLVFIEKEIGSDEALSEIKKFNPDYCFHLAAQSLVGLSYK